ncbi:alpha-glucosidase (family GH31 glycosyl hydrolase) [Caldalkalibacillus uzonensis]|uniref:Alpha-glucosidase (Family GH31 glycosyl hydrolase) n=1 Tax=Caldalkalibacillus uzonensis TaxID=353224 RepID=A0ABU0CSK7_9BACI|nr:TIM-barrel domain-containing protein [Caldalkalibacillus uzonensis]MDQ0338460.1 alpha-glucosidase (family GH31 glycosyl hydrolase) [Caldalkalibacillus uzonensis]
MSLMGKLFRAYCYQLEKRFNQSEQILKQSAEQTGKEDHILPKAVWIWMLAEHQARSNEHQLVIQYQSLIEHAVNFICDHWQQPASNIWGESDDLIHISNLGICYGALNAAKRLTGQNILQKYLTEIRDFVFEHGLSGGMLIRAKDKREVSTDLLATVMPFGLFSPEDLVLVEAVKAIEERLVYDNKVYHSLASRKESPASTAWLAWYFTEKGELDKGNFYLKTARQLLSGEDSGDGELADALIDIVNHYLSEALPATGEVRMIHTPFGHDNPYHPLQTDREPKLPQAGQDVKVRAQVWPEPENGQVFVHVRTESKEYEVKCVKKHQEDNVLWEASLGSFSLGETVRYAFYLQLPDRTVRGKEEYSFSPLALNELASVSCLGVDENTLWLKGEDTLQLHNVYIGMGNTAEGWRCEVRLADRGKSASPGIDLPPQQKQSLLHWQEDEEQIQLFGPNGTCVFRKKPFHIQVLDGKENILLSGYEHLLPVLQWSVDSEGQVYQMRWNFHSPLDERFYGMGERYHRLQYRGERIDCYVYNQYRDQGSRTYLPAPFYLSSKGYGFFLDHPCYSVFDFAHQFEDLLSINIDLNPARPFCSFHLFSGEPKEVLQHYTAVTGKPVLPPVWAFGPWMSSNNWDRESVVKQQVELTNRYQIPATVLVLEQWSDECTYYIFNDAEYDLKPGHDFFNYEDFHFPAWGRWPNPKALIDYVHQQGMKVILWQIPIQKYLNKQSHAQKDEDERYMIEAGYVVKEKDGRPYRIPEGWFKGSLLMDFSNNEACEWWFSKRKYLLEIGVDGFKTDGGEFVFGRDVQFADGRTGAEMRNLYPNDYVQAYFDFASSYHNGEALTFSRAGYAGAQNFPAHWAGDERSTFDAFRHSLIAGLSSGLSGIPFWGWDLAGFNGEIPTCELFIRSAQMAAFCPIMQYHAESKAEFNQDRTPWNIAERTGDRRAIEGYRFYANLRMNLLPYIFAQAKTSSLTGVPLMRSLWLEFPDDLRCYSVYDQYLFGDDLLVAPVIEEGATERMVYFPQGKWIDLWTNEVVTGPCWKRVKAPLLKIPVYVRQGTVLACNCGEDLKLGTWVGNRVDQYAGQPVLRLYPAEGMTKTVEDHLQQTWSISCRRADGQWQIDVNGPKGTVCLIPQSLLEGEQTILVNGREIQPNKQATTDDSCVVIRL